MEHFEVVRGKDHGLRDEMSCPEPPASNRNEKPSVVTPMYFLPYSVLLIFPFHPEYIYLLNMWYFSEFVIVIWWGEGQVKNQ